MAKFGELTATQVWAAAARTLTDISAEEIYDLPALSSSYPPVNVTSAAEANTFGAWGQVLANVGTGKRLILLAVVGVTNDDVHVEIQLGEGTAGNETVIDTVAYYFTPASAAGIRPPLVFPLFRQLTDGARLSARARDSSASALTHNVVAMYA